MTDDEQPCEHHHQDPAVEAPGELLRHAAGRAQAPRAAVEVESCGLRLRVQPLQHVLARPRGGAAVVQGVEVRDPALAAVDDDEAEAAGGAGEAALQA